MSSLFDMETRSTPIFSQYSDNASLCVEQYSHKISSETPCKVR